MSSNFAIELDSTTDIDILSTETTTSEWTLLNYGDEEEEIEVGLGRPQPRCGFDEGLDIFVLVHSGRTDDEGAPVTNTELLKNRRLIRYASQERADSVGDDSDPRS